MEFCVGTHPYDLWDAGGRDAMLAKHARQLSLNGSFMQEGRRREDAERLRKMLDADGLLAITSHPPFGSYNEPFSVLRQDPDGLQRELAWMKEFLVRCGILGIRAIPLHTGGAMLPQSQPLEVDCAKAYVEALLPTAEKAGVIIAIENTNHAMPLSFYPHMTEQVPLNKNIWSFDDTQKILSFVQAFDSPFVRICYDTGHSHLLGRMLADHGAFEPWIALYHLHDNEGAGNDAHWQPGYGNAPWKAFFARLQETPSIPPLFIEAEPFHKDLKLMLSEMQAISEGRVQVKPGGFLKKNEDTGRLLILDQKEDVSC